MKKEIIKYIFGVMIVFITLVIVAYSSVNIKTKVLRSIYEDSVFSRISVDVKPYVRQFEYGIANGKKIENFFDAKKIINEAIKTSSYIKGIYIVSTENTILYTEGEEPSALDIKRDKNAKFSNKKMYDVVKDSKFFYLTTTISDANSAVVGYMIICMDRTAVENPIINTINDYILQSIIIFIEAAGICLIALKRIDFKNFEKAISRVASVLILAIILGNVLDCSVTVYKISAVINEAAIQSANRMTIAMQSSLDHVIAAGAPKDSIHDLNAWLLKNTLEVPFIDSISVNSDMKIVSKVSYKYLNEYYYQLILEYIVMTVGCVIIILLIMVIVKKIYRIFKNKTSNTNSN